MDEDTEVYYSCSAQLNGELFVFGGANGEKKKQVHLLNYHTCKPIKFQISKIIGCGLKRIGDLAYEFFAGACGTFLFPQQRIFLCFGSFNKNKCQR